MASTSTTTTTTTTTTAVTFFTLSTALTLFVQYVGKRRSKVLKKRRVEVLSPLKVLVAGQYFVDGRVNAPRLKVVASEVEEELIRNSVVLRFQSLQTDKTFEYSFDWSTNELIALNNSEQSPFLEECLKGAFTHIQGNNKGKEGVFQVTVELEAGYNTCEAIFTGGTSNAFTSTLVKALLKSFELDGSDEVVHKIAQSVDAKFDIHTMINATIEDSSNSIKPPALLELPPAINIVVGVIDDRASSNSSIELFLAAKEAKGSILSPMWTQLRAVNSRITQILTELKDVVKDGEDSSKKVVQKLNNQLPSEWSKTDNEIVKFIELNELLQDGRSLLKYIGEIAEIHIESATSKTLLDEALQAQGVLGGGVAGAAGSEAIFALTVSEEATKRIEELWQFKGVRTLTVIPYS